VSDETAIIERLDALTQGFAQLARLMGARLTRQEVCERLGIHRNTLRTYIADRDFPKPGRDGKWLLAEVVEWEARK
jgi:predicted DNA-binding transcriptional regulator AlpA